MCSHSRPRPACCGNAFFALQKALLSAKPLREGPLRGRLFRGQRSHSLRRVLPMQLKLTTRTVKGILVVNCDGRIVFGEESAELRDTVKKLITQNNQMVLNLDGVSYIDSGGLGTLVALYTTAHNAGGAIKLSNLTQRVGDLLQVTKLLTIFEVFDSEEEAIQSFRKGAAA